MARTELIRARASKEEKERVEKIRKIVGLENEAEVVRYCLRIVEQIIDERKAAKDGK